MYQEKDFTKEFYKPKDVAQVLGVSVRTVQNYDKQGLLSFERTEKDRRLIKKQDLLNYLDSKHMLCRNEIIHKKSVIYARVSSHEQKSKGDLDRQALFLISSISNRDNIEILQEVGSGLNDKRPELLKLIEMVMDDQVEYIYITYKDRLTRFGYNYLEQIFRQKGVEIIVITDVSKKKSVEEELVEDMMALIASFSGKLYGLRSNKNRRE
ncbi:MAG: hypothetical protein BEN19_00710 [Epulopiscium sp. Nuni2H_MBin003]|nr:MAG: hypothetical protein BEN19_00710 [Epulopiscium sp. Nuni2H_MBin003]